jgi:phospholipid/cholesterol/gamma-HCH transport system substrate-binding protein
MTISREIKAGFIALVALLSFIWGFQFLKGRNVLHETRVFYAVYKNVDGLTVGRPVTLNGFQIGTVSDISFLPDMSGGLVVKLEIDNSFPFSSNSLLKIYGADLMGAKSLSIEVVDGTEVAESGDTLKGAIEPAITTVLNDEVQPLKKKVEHLLVSLDSTSSNINRLTSAQNGKNIEEAIANLNKTLASFSKISKQVEKNNQQIDSIFSNVNYISQNLRQITDSLNDVEIKKTVQNFNSLLVNLDSTMEKLNNGDGSMAKLLNDPSFYNNLNSSAKELSELLLDLKLNPKRYVHISVFEKKNQEYEKPVVDSLQKN